MKLKSAIAAAGIILASSASQAGVVYQWVEVENKMPIGVSIRIEIEESVVRSGFFNLAVAPGNKVIPNTGLVSYSYASSYASPTSWLPANHGFMYMNLQFVDNNFRMIGSIRTSDWMTRLDASSGTFGNPDARLWRINNTDRDPFTPCYAEPNGFCSGATGYFRQVPEPTSVALLGLGLAGALAARRRKRKT